MGMGHFRNPEAYKNRYLEYYHNANIDKKEDRKWSQIRDALSPLEVIKG